MLVSISPSMMIAGLAFVRRLKLSLLLFRCAEIPRVGMGAFFIIILLSSILAFVLLG